MTIVINRRTVHVALIVLAVAGLAWWGWHHVSPGRTIIDSERLTALDPDNAGINIAVRQPWLSDSVLVFDIGRPTDRDFDRIDVTRCLLQCAQDLQDEPLSRVYLARNGRRLYYIAGDDFKRIGQDYHKGERWNNTVLATRIPTVTRTLNDSVAFPANDGILGAVNDADDWNSMMSTLLKDEKRSPVTQLLSLFRL